MRLLYTGLRVRNLDRSIRFYRALGMRVVLRGRTRLGGYAHLSFPRSRHALELNYFPRGSPAFQPFRRGSELDHLGFLVDKVDAWVNRVVRKGGKVKVRPFDAQIVLAGRPPFPGRAAYVADPDGIWLELMGPTVGRVVGRSPKHRKRARRDDVS